MTLSKLLTVVQKA